MAASSSTAAAVTAVAAIPAASPSLHPLRAARHLRDTAASATDIIAAFEHALTWITSSSNTTKVPTTTASAAATKNNGYDSDDDDKVSLMQQSECWFEIGRVHSSCGDHDAAIVAFKKAHHLDSNDMATLINLANQYISLEQYDDALSIIDTIIHVDATHARAWCLRATCLAATHRIDDSLAAFNKSILYDSKDHRTYRSMASVLDDCGDRSDDAIAAYQQCLALKPDDSVTIFNLCTVFLQAGRTMDAIPLLQRYTTLVPDDCDGWSSLAISLALYDGVEQKASSLAAFDRWIVLSPDTGDAHYGRGSLLDRLGRRVDALASYDHALTINDDDPLVWRARGVTLFAMNRKAAALESYERAAKLNADDIATWVNMACVLASMMKRDEALICYDRALTIVADDWQVLRNKGGLLVRMERFTEAKACWEAVLVAMPDDERTRINLKNLNLAIAIDAEEAEEYRIATSTAFSVVAPAAVAGVTGGVPTPASVTSSSAPSTSS